MIEKVDPKFVPMYIKKDPVRPHINAETRMMPGRDVDEETLLSANIGPVVVAYTVWSLEKGMGRKIILDLQAMIRETYRFKRLVTLSPKTEMATKFHLSNGAELIAENMTTNNFEYDIEW